MCSNLVEERRKRGPSESLCCRRRFFHRILLRSLHDTTPRQDCQEFVHLHLSRHRADADFCISSQDDRRDFVFPSNPAIHGNQVEKGCCRSHSGGRRKNGRASESTDQSTRCLLRFLSAFCQVWSSSASSDSQHVAVDGRRTTERLQIRYIRVIVHIAVLNLSNRDF